MSKMPTKRADRQLEETVKDDVKAVFNKHGWFWWMPASNMYGTGGVSDFHATKHRLFMAVETKRGSKKPKPTANQIAFLQEMRSHGHYAFVVNQPRVALLDAFLGAFERATEDTQKLGKVANADGALMLDCIREMQMEF